MPVEIRTIQQAYTYALDATPRQTRAFLSHAGGARFAFNWAADQCAHAIDAYHHPTRRMPVTPLGRPPWA